MRAIVSPRNAAALQGYIPAFSSNLLSPAQVLRPEFTVNCASTTRQTFGPNGLMSQLPAAVPRFWFDPTALVPMGLYADEGATNDCLWSSDCTNAAWVKTSITAAKDATGLDGVANSASTLTATGANGTCLQTITLAAASRSFGVWIKRKTGTGTISITRNGGTAWTDVTSQINSTNWTRVVIENTSVLNPVVGIRITTNGDAVFVDNAQDNSGAWVRSPIQTSGSTVAVLREQIVNVNVTPFWNPNQGSIIVEVTRDSLNSNGNFPWAISLFNVGQTEQLGFYYNEGAQLYAIRVQSNNVNVLEVGIGAPAGPGAPLTLGASWDSSGINYCQSGFAPVATNAPAPNGALITQMCIGSENNTGAVSLGGKIRRFAYYRQKLPLSVLASLTKTTP